MSFVQVKGILYMYREANILSYVDSMRVQGLKGE